jgi:ParB family chromosome partitioning protein
VEEGLSVRAVESIVARAIVLEGKKTPKKLANIEATESSIFERTQYEHIEDQLRNALGTRVAVRGGKNGKIEIDYYSSDELTRIVDVICGN